MVWSPVTPRVAHRLSPARRSSAEQRTTLSGGPKGPLPEGADAIGKGTQSNYSSGGDGQGQERRRRPEVPYQRKFAVAPTGGLTDGDPMELPGRTFIARHGETVFNAARRMQGVAMDTPLTRAGFVQAEGMGAALANYLGPDVPPLALWASTSGRALQTLAVVCEHIGADWHTARHDARLCEIDVGRWGGRTYAEISAEQGQIVNADHHLFSVRPPGGEWYDDIATRLGTWVETARDDGRDRLVLMHGISSRVLRGLLTGTAHDQRWRCGVAPNLSQGSMVMIENGNETLIAHGDGTAPA